MELIHLTETNAKDYIGKQIIFKVKETPYLYTLANIIGKHFVVETERNKHFLLSVKYPTFVIVDNKTSSNSLHYSMNLLKASPNTISSYLGNYVLVQSSGKENSIAKIKSVSKSLQYIFVNSGLSEKCIDIKTTSCYIIV
jgi:hypothetical protein